LFPSRLRVAGRHRLFLWRKDLSLASIALHDAGSGIADITFRDCMNTMAALLDIGISMTHNCEMSETTASVQRYRFLFRTRAVRLSGISPMSGIELLTCSKTMFEERAVRIAREEEPDGVGFGGLVGD
jgi:hypothetical protein